MENALNPFFFNVCGFQETRNAPGHKTGQNFYSVSSGCAVENGTKKYGCDIWFNLVVPIILKDDSGSKKEVFVTADNVSVVFQHPRYICATLEVDGVCLYFISLHFPRKECWAGRML